MFALSIFSYICLYGFLEYGKRSLNWPSAYTRKIAHIASAGGALMLYPFFEQKMYIVVVCLFLLGFIVSYKKHFLTSVHLTHYRTYGEIFFPLSIIYLALFHFDDPSVFLTSLLVMGLSDAVAGIYDIPHHGQTLIGRGIFFLSTVVILGSLPFFLLAPPLSLLALLSIAALLTLIESISTYGLDNLSVPVACSILLSIMT